jgi:hypothetical protein
MAAEVAGMAAQSHFGSQSRWHRTVHTVDCPRLLKIGMDDDGVLSGPPPVTRNAGDPQSERCRVKDKAA